ncbi:MAG: heavy metal-associated domain-containing protein [Candidatus Thermoplasmatota archaeon]
MSPPEQAFTLQITGMTCQNCVNHVEKALRSTPGVTEATVNLKKETAQVRAKPGASTTTMVAAVKEAGYGVKAVAGTEAPTSRWTLWRR